jgi:D-serine deaminase-like pyridoxal phosphate-dependent protein
MDVPPRDLICRPLAALKNNRAEAEEHEAELCTVVTNGATNGAPAAKYQPGVYLMMDWVASRLHKAGAAVWAIIFNLDEVDCLFELALFAA